MPNMSYCRFTNTLADLRDVYDHMDDDEELNFEEKSARKQLIQLCEDIAAEYGEEE